MCGRIAAQQALRVGRSTSKLRLPSPRPSSSFVRPVSTMRITLVSLLLLLVMHSANAHIPNPRTAEDHVYFLTAMHANCSLNQPALKPELDLAFQEMKSKNRKYFETTERSSHYEEVIAILRRELYEVSSTPRDCGELIKALRSSQSDLSLLPE